MLFIGFLIFVFVATVVIGLVRDLFSAVIDASSPASQMERQRRS